MRPDPSATTPEPPEVLVEYLEHLDANAALYCRVLGEHGSAVAVARLRARLEEVVTEGIARSSMAGVFDELPHRQHREARGRQRRKRRDDCCRV